MITTIDDCYPRGLINAALATWPDERWCGWHRYTGKMGEKFATKDALRVPTACKLLIEKMSEFRIDDNCFPDLDLHGAGMHWIKEGGRLPLHRDATTHPLTSWTRRFNAVLFLEACEGGELVFSDTGETIKPEPGRLALFPVDSPHEVLTVKRGDRRTLSLFWWDLSESSGSTTAEWMTNSSTSLSNHRT